uniref:Uncharacterized protein n=1 Tax=Siphoviridae sp. ctL5G6 TaxID=2826247 RepID=A0A8S5N9D3_9CAUD|nr:MAG TPA: hypothetical protein [Siphoviridae sp. ctL5G6]
MIFFIRSFICVTSFYFGFYHVGATVSITKFSSANNFTLDIIALLCYSIAKLRRT